MKKYKEEVAKITNESIPHWASHLTSDAHGNVYAWEYKPYLGSGSSDGEYEYWDADTAGDVEYIGKTLLAATKKYGCYETVKIELW